MFFVKRQHQCVHRLDQFRLLGLLGLLDLLDLLVFIAALPVITLMANLNCFSVLTFTLRTKDILGLSVYFVLQSFHKIKSFHDFI